MKKTADTLTCDFRDVNGYFNINITDEERDSYPIYAILRLKDFNFDEDKEENEDDRMILLNAQQIIRLQKFLTNAIDFFLIKEEDWTK